MFARWSAFFVWALVAAGAVAWGLKLFVRPLAAPAQTVVAAPAAAAGGDWTRVLGAAPPPPPVVAEAAPPPPPESSRFQLIGVVAPRPAGARSQGVALIAVDGKTPRAYRVGAVIDGEHVLQSVQQRAVSIGPRQGQATVMLELPALPPPSTGIPGAMPTPAMPPGNAVPAAMPPPAVLPAMPGGARPGGQLPVMPTLGAPVGSAAPVMPLPGAQAPLPNPGMFPAGRRPTPVPPPNVPTLNVVPEDPDPPPPMDSRRQR